MVLKKTTIFWNCEVCKTSFFEQREAEACENKHKKVKNCMHTWEYEVFTNDGKITLLTRTCSKCGQSQEYDASVSGANVPNSVLENLWRRLVA